MLVTLPYLILLLVLAYKDYLAAGILGFFYILWTSIMYRILSHWSIRFFDDHVQLTLPFRVLRIDHNRLVAIRLRGQLIELTHRDDSGYVISGLRARAFTPTQKNSILQRVAGLVANPPSPP